MAWTKTIRTLDLSDVQVKRIRYILGTGIGAIIGILFFLVQLFITRKYVDLAELAAFISMSIIIEGICLDIVYEIFRINKTIKPETT